MSAMRFGMINRSVYSTSIKINCVDSRSFVVVRPLLSFSNSGVNIIGYVPQTVVAKVA